MRTLAHITIDDVWIVGGAIVAGFVLGTTYAAGVAIGRRRVR